MPSLAIRSVFRELGRYCVNSAHSQLRQKALLGELDPQRLADIGLLRGPTDFWGRAAYTFTAAERFRRDIEVFDATTSDISAIRSIYAHHVKHGLASFEEVPPSIEEMRKRWQSVVDAKLPYLVAKRGERVLGYCYASSYRPRPAYRHTIEDSVYILPGAEGQGIGRLLLTALIERCEQGPWRQMIAVIGDSGNAGSIGLHRALGFRDVGVIRNAGFKFGRWVDSVLMQRALAPRA